MDNQDPTTTSNVPPAPKETRAAVLVQTLDSWVQITTSIVLLVASIAVTTAVIVTLSSRLTRPEATFGGRETGQAATQAEDQAGLGEQPSGDVDSPDASPPAVSSDEEMRKKLMDDWIREQRPRMERARKEHYAK